MYFKFFFLIFLLGTLHASERYKLIHLDLLDFESSEGTGINNDGQICGIYQHKGKKHVFIWESGQINYLNIRPSHKPVINDQKQIYGSYWFQTTDGLWDFDQEVAFCWKNPLSYFTLLNLENLKYPKETNKQFPFDQERTVVWDVNDLGQLVLTNRETFKDLLLGNPSRFHYRVWIYHQGRYQEITAPHFWGGFCINNQQQVLGCFCENKEGLIHNQVATISIYDIPSQAIRTLSFPSQAFGKDLNDRGQIVGIFLNPEINTFQGFLFDLSNDSLQIFEKFAPLKINNQGQIIGKFLEGEKENRPAIWEKGEIVDLLEEISLIDDQGYIWDSLETLVDINDEGEIIGQGKYQGKPHAFLLRPKNL